MDPHSGTAAVREYVYRGHSYQVREPLLKMSYRKKTVHALSMMTEEPTYKRTLCGLDCAEAGLKHWRATEDRVTCVMCIRSMIGESQSLDWWNKAQPLYRSFVEPPKVGDLIDAVREARWDYGRFGRTLVSHGHAAGENYHGRVIHDRQANLWYVTEMCDGLELIKSVHEADYGAFEEMHELWEADQRAYRQSRGW